MNPLIYAILFMAGTAVGSFFNVLTLRFNPEEKESRLLKNIYGRSHCPHCGRELRWYELIPIFSFLLQRGKCRSCGAGLTLQYPIVEFLGGLIFILVPYSLLPIHPLLPIPYFLISVWILVLLALLMMSVIDFRHHIIPDSINVFIGIVGVALICYKYFFLSLEKELGGGSFLGSYALMFPFSGDFLLASFIGLIFGLGFLGALFVITRGRGMGLGDVKLSAALGLLMGWPDIVLALILAFITGAVLSLALIFTKRKSMKDYVPFGPFIALGVVLVFFFGQEILNLYFRFFDSFLPL